MPKSGSAVKSDAPGKMDDYVYSPEARIDLLEIWEHVAADRVEQAIQRAVSMLAKTPGLGHIRSDLTSMPVRFWTVYSYLVIYNPDTRPLEVVRILSGYRDVASLLK